MPRGTKTALCGCVALLLLGDAAHRASAQARKDDLWSSLSASEINRMIGEANVWDSNADQVYTCAEWKKYVGDLFNQADRNRDGYVDTQEFKTIQELAPQFRAADLGYFDDNRDGRLSRSEFVDKPNPFFLRFDKNRDCQVTLDEIMGSVSSPTASGKKPAGR